MAVGIELSSMSNFESSIDTRSVVRGENSLVVFMAFIALAHRLRVDGMLLAGRERGVKSARKFRIFCK